MAVRSFLLLCLATLLLFSIFTISLTKDVKHDAHHDDEEDEDLSFLEEPEDTNAAAANSEEFPEFDQFEEEQEDDDEEDEDLENFSDAEESEVDQEAYMVPEVDDKDVIVLKTGNFTEFVETNKFLMVEFYAPWCGHCHNLAPEYAEAATELKGEGVVLAKVDATEEDELAEKYEVQGFPTIYMFVDGVHKPYTGQRIKDAIVTWIRKKTGPGVFNITTLKDAERILSSETKLVVAYLNHLTGPESEEFAAASRLEDTVNFYQTVNADIAPLFHLDHNVKRPAVVMLKNETERFSYFDGKFVKSEIAEFVVANKLPLVTIFTRETAPQIFESEVKKQVLLFSLSNDTENILPTFQEAAKLFKGKLIFVHVEMDNADFGRPVCDYFGISGDDPVVLGFIGNDDNDKFRMDGEFTLDNIKVFGEKLLVDELKPFYKSDPIPETNDGDVKIAVGNNFDEIVLDDSKDVLLQIYAPWCGHCHALEPTYNKLAKHLRGSDSIVLAKMDGTSNEHPRAKAEGFPTLLFFPAGNKTSDPIPVDSDRTAVALYKFLKKHASIPFRLQDSASSTKASVEGTFRKASNDELR